MQSKHSISKGTSECGSWSRARCLRNVSRAGTWLDTGLRFQARARLQSPSTFPSVTASSPHPTDGDFTDQGDSTKESQGCLRVNVSQGRQS